MKWKSYSISGKSEAGQFELSRNSARFGGKWLSPISMSSRSTRKDADCFSLSGMEVRSLFSQLWQSVERNCKKLCSHNKKKNLSLICNLKFVNFSKLGVETSWIVLLSYCNLDAGESCDITPKILELCSILRSMAEMCQLTVTSKIESREGYVPHVVYIFCSCLASTIHPKCNKS